MNFRPYPEYKESGVEWLGKVPSHWEVIRFKYRMYLQRGYDLPIEECIEGIYPVYGSNGVIAFHSEYTTKGPGITIGRSGSVGEVQFISEDFWAHNTAIFVKNFIGTNPKFAYYLLNSIDIKSLSFGTAVGSLDRNNIHDLTISVPPMPEQIEIASFLDEETARIDELIKRKQEQIDLLREKRVALINKYCLTGINDSVGMRPTDIEWIEQIPVSWQVKKIGHLLTASGYKAGPFGSSLITSELLDLGTIKVLTPEHIASNCFELTFDQYLPDSRRDEMSQYFVRANDVIFPIVGTLGRAMVIPNELGDAIINQRLARLRPNTNLVLPEYLRLLLTEVDFYQQLDKIESKGAILDHITKEMVLNRPVLLPSLEEQHSILNRITIECTKIEDLLQLITDSINALTNYRTSLISSAVTGKFQVEDVYEN